MRERPAPEELAHPDSLARLRAHGYRVVHPDDVPAEPGPGLYASRVDWKMGMEDYRRRIFGESLGAGVREGTG